MSAVCVAVPLEHKLAGGVAMYEILARHQHFELNYNFWARPSSTLGPQRPASLKNIDLMHTILHLLQYGTSDLVNFVGNATFNNSNVDVPVGRGSSEAHSTV